MALKPGTLLGPYEVLALIGAGGMGEVYKGRDTRLDRFVALKVLAPHLVDHPEARQRFEREAQTVANLKHPNICVLYDIGKQEVAASEGTPAALLAKAGFEAKRVIHFLVLEHLEGETLAQRLAKGSLPLEQVLQYAAEVSDALDKAHRAGVTHRDIKPGNIMIVPQTGSGPKTSTKLLDFGLAKLKQEVLPNLPRSEWPTGMGAPTVQGTILGTPHYMAPEQAEGKVDELDARTDIFSFGATVYEMVTGKKAFDGKTPTSVIASILKEDPPAMSSLQPLTPPALDHVVRKCLRKAPEERWQNVRDVTEELEWIAESGKQVLMSQATAAQAAAVPTPVAAPRKSRERLGWIAAAVLLVGLVAALVPVVRYFRQPPGYASPARFLVDTPQGSATNQLAVSPDGRHLAFVAPASAGGGNLRLWVRSLDSVTALSLPGTEGASQPFWSPDSRFLGFFAGGKLKKIEVSGGPAQTLCDSGLSLGGTWNEDGVIVFSRGNDLFRVSAAGGEPTKLTTGDASRGGAVHIWPYFLPDGRHFLHTVAGGQPGNLGIYVGSVDSEERTRLLADNSMSLYAPPGYLLFVRQGTVMAQPFDAARLRLTGDVFPIVEQVANNAANARGGFAISGNGVLAYRAGSGIVNSQLAWFDRAGRQLGTIGPPGAYLNPKLSPDGKRVAVEQVTSGNRDIWILEIERGIASRFTFDPAEEFDPLWSPDGKQVAFTSKGNVYQKPSSGGGTEEILLKGAVGTSLWDWSPDGGFIAYRPVEGSDISVLPLVGEHKPFPFLQTQFLEVQSQISPDGKWAAYMSDESGRNEVYVQSFPKPGAKWQISTNGAVQPRWRRDGKELFYIAPDGKLMAVSVRGETTLEVGAPQALFETRTVEGPITRQYMIQQYDVSPDGQRFLMNVGPEAPSTSPITVVLNWTAGIKK